MEKIKIENLIFKYPQRDVLALNNISLTINKGEFLLICGKSGCGKSTLLRMLKPSLSPHGQISGTISFDGGDIKALNQKEQAKRIGFVMQNPDTQIVCDKVWHELSFGLENLGLNTAEIRARVAETASFFGIQNWFYRNVSELSGGQKRCAAIAGVLAMQPEILVLDEPAAGLDPETKHEIFELLCRIREKRNNAIVLVSHHMEDVAQFANRVWVMYKGKIAMDGTPEEVYSRVEELEKMNIGIPQITHLTYLLIKEGIPLPRPAISVEEAEKMLAEILKEEKPL